MQESYENPLPEASVTQQVTQLGIIYSFTAVH